MESQRKPSVDVTLCEKEPIHIPGTIQPHGCLLITDEDLVITHISQNARSWFPAAGPKLIGMPLEKLVDEKDLTTLRQLCAPSSPDHHTKRGILRPRHQTTAVSWSVHRSGKRWLFELEPFDETLLDDYYSRCIPLLSEFCAEIGKRDAATDILDYSVDSIRTITGFDRVLAYRFDADWHGVVIAESRCDEMVSFLGLHFPASDIPAQARRLYEVNPIRTIADRLYVPVPLLPLAGPETKDPIDLTHVSLRSVSPIHLEYLGNLGVTASMSISILVDGKLWGLIACHHRVPLRVPPNVRDQSLLMGKIISLRLQSSVKLASSAETFRWRTRAGEIAARCSLYPNITEGLGSSVDLLKEWIPADGFAITERGTCVTYGSPPPDSAIATITAWLEENHPHEVFSTTSLAPHFPVAEQWRSHAAGILSIPIRGSVGNFLILFRSEVLQTTAWAGNPSKSVIVVNDTAHLSPRRSFAIWSQVTHLHSIAWSEEELREGNYLCLLLQHILQSRVESFSAEAHNVKERHALTMAFMHETVQESVELARGIRFSLEKAKTAAFPSLATEGRRTLENLVESSLNLAQFLEDVGHSTDSLFSSEKLETSPIDELIATAWSRYRESFGHLQRSYTLTIKPEKSTPTTPSPLAPKTIIPCLEQLLRATADSLSADQDTIVLEYAVTKASALAPLIPNNHVNSTSTIVLAVRAADGVPLDCLINPPAESPHPNLTVTNAFAYRLSCTAALARALGGSLHSLHTTTGIPSLLLIFPLPQGVSL